MTNQLLAGNLFCCVNGAKLRLTRRDDFYRFFYRNKSVYTTCRYSHFWYCRT